MECQKKADLDTQKWMTFGYNKGTKDDRSISLTV